MKIIQSDMGKRAGIHYEFAPSEKPLGIGGMGTVYRGWRFDDYSGQQREVAIKELSVGLPQHVIVRARREASLQLRNDNLIEMIDFVEVRSKDELGTPVIRYYVVSEFLHGITLDALLCGKVTDYKGEVIPFAQELYGQYLNDSYHFALTVIRSILSGLMALHDAGFIHRDIDPSNIMITSDSHIKLIDFGIAKNIRNNHTDEASYTQVGQFIGKPKYAAPELARGLTNSLGIPTDLYAVGILFFQLVVGHVPFDGEMAEVLEMQINKKMPLQEIKQPELRKIINTATKKNKEQRFQSAAEFRVAVDRLVALSYPEKKVNLLKAGSVISVFAIVVGCCLWFITSNNSDILKNRAVTNIIPSESKSKASVDTNNDAVLYLDIVEDLKNEITAERGLEQLNQLTKSSSAEIAYRATYLLSRLYFANSADKSEIPDSIKQMQVALDNIILIDNEKAHVLLLKAVEINDTDYHSLYELGCNYMSKDKRGATKNLELARTYLQKALSLAKQAGDKDYQTRISVRLSKL